MRVAAQREVQDRLAGQGQPRRYRGVVSDAGRVEHPDLADAQFRGELHDDARDEGAVSGLLGEVAVASQRVLDPVVLQSLRQPGVKVLDRLIEAGVQDGDASRAVGFRPGVLIARRRRLRVGLRPSVVLVLTGEHVVRPDVGRGLAVLVLPQLVNEGWEVHPVRDLERQDRQPGLAEASGELFMRRRAHLPQPAHCRAREPLLALDEDVPGPVQVPRPAQHRGMSLRAAPPRVAVQVVACLACRTHPSPVPS